MIGDDEIGSGEPDDDYIAVLSRSISMSAHRANQKRVGGRRRTAMFAGAAMFAVY
jgi:hypothetical protein